MCAAYSCDCGCQCRHVSTGQSVLQLVLMTSEVVQSVMGRSYRKPHESNNWNCNVLLLPSVPSVHWRCWLGVRKGIWPVKTEWWGAGMVICLEQGADLHMAQQMPLPLTVSCFSKIQIGLPFWCRLTRVVLDEGPLNGVCVLLYTWQVCQIQRQPLLNENLNRFLISKINTD